MLGDRKTVVLRGGAPWGFRLSGGGQTPVHIAKVRSRSKAALGGLAAGDTLVSVNGIAAVQHSLREINDIIDTIRDQLILEVQSVLHSRGNRLDSSSSIDTRENSPIRSIHRITPQPKSMDYIQYASARTTPTSSYTPYSAMQQSFNNNYDYQQSSKPISNYNDQRYNDSYRRPSNSPMGTLFRTTTITSNSPPTPIAKARIHQISPIRVVSNSNYDIPRNHNSSSASGYMSDTNDIRRSSISMRPSSNIANLQSRFNTDQQSSNNYLKVSNNQNEANYYSDSEYVTSGPRYYKISRQVNTSRRPSNVVLPIRSMTSKAYETYVPPPEPTAPVEVYRPQPVVTARFTAPPQLSMPTTELGAELMKSPIADKKRYADSSFFKTAYNTYPTIDDQKTMARKIASILEGGDPTQKGSTKFEKQRQRAEKYTIENEASTLSPAAYRPLRTLQTNETYHVQSMAATPTLTAYTNSSNLPNPIKHSLNQAQYINPLRYVGAPEEFKQMHMQEHVTHTNVPPQAAMNLVADLNSNRDRGAALFQKRRARSEKWVIDENNVKKPEFHYQSLNTNPTPISQPWGQQAPPAWSSDMEQPRLSPVRLPIVSPEPVQSGPRFGDFNAKPKGFGTWTADNGRSQSPRVPIDGRKVLNLNIEPSIREGIAESHTRSASLPWSPPSAGNPYFNYPADNFVPTPSSQAQSRPNSSNHLNGYSSTSANYTDL